MKFNCYYRAKDGSRQVIELNAIDRNKAFCQAKHMGLTIIELVSENNRRKPLKNTSKPTKVVSVVKKPMDMETMIYKQREHSYILGFLLGPIGFVISCMVWKQRGMKYGVYGLGIAVLTFLLGWFIGIVGFIAGCAIAVLSEHMIIPKPNDERIEWNKL